MIVLLDSASLGILSNPNSIPATLECRYWSERLVATTNVGHLERFVNAKYWQAIA